LVHSAAAHANGHHEVTDNELATLIADVGAVNSFATEITTAWQQSSAGVQRCWESAQERGTKPAALLRRMLKDEDHLRSARRTKLTGSARTLAKAAEARRIEADGAK
jgi:hypothetical protein